MALPNETTSIEGINDLTEQEKEQLLIVMRRAKKFEMEEEKNLLRQPLEGQLLKFTNVMKGYQFRWFVLNPDAGQLEYYEKEEHRRTAKPRGSLTLANANVSPSEEDSQTFFVYAGNGEFFRLKALDARERQYWVSRLRAVAEFHTDLTANSPYSSLAPHTPHMTSREGNAGSSCSLQNVGQSASNPASGRAEAHFLEKSRGQSTFAATPDNLSVKKYKRATRSAESAVSVGPVDTLRDAKDLISELQKETDHLEEEIRVLSASGDITRLDKDLLLAKAASRATLSCLEECLRILRETPAAYNYPFCETQGQLMNGGTAAARPVSAGATSPPVAALSPAFGDTPAADRSEKIMEAFPPSIVGMDMEAVPVRHEEDESDHETSASEPDTTSNLVEEHKSVILHLLSQLKLGMDLTKVVLPTFILEKRSLLEMFADCMAHPYLFLRINDCPDPELRIMAVLEWFLTSFHAGRQGCLAKKPYNPIIGETFHCSWRVSVNDNPADDVYLYYTAEQVSHHPPVSAFHFECPQHGMSLDASIYTKSKFNGMSICAVMVGKLCLRLERWDNEEYVFTLPTAYARSILSVPWVELGDKVSLSCPKSKYSATALFHVKPFYGGKLHQISGEVRNPNGQIVSKVAGEWNGILEFEYLGKGPDKKLLDVTSLPITPKRVRPLAKQRPHESRRLWQHVTRALKQGNLQLATEQKKQLEEQQRASERYRKEHNLAFPVKFFQRAGETWHYSGGSKTATEPCPPPTVDQPHESS